MRNENINLAHFKHFSSFFTKFPCTIVENSLQIGPFLQNKANSPSVQMNVRTVSTKLYDKFRFCRFVKNKPKQSQIFYPQRGRKEYRSQNTEYIRQTAWSLRTRRLNRYKAKESQFSISYRNMAISMPVMATPTAGSNTLEMILSSDV